MTEIALLIQAGANACFSGGVTRLVFLKSLELVMLGETLLPSTLLSSIGNREEAPVAEPAEAGDTARLTAQEERILHGLVEGHPDKVIASKLGMAAATVKIRVQSILRKIGAHNRTQAAVWAINNVSVDCLTDDGLPGRVLVPEEAPSPVATSSVHGQSPVKPCVAGSGSQLPGRTLVPEEASAPVATSSVHGQGPVKPCVAGSGSLLPGRALVPEDASSPVATSFVHGQGPVKPCVAGDGSLEKIIERATAASSTQDKPNSTSKSAFVWDHAWRSERRIAEEEERRVATTARSGHLRALREARDAAEAAGREFRTDSKPGD
jgi:DNA-binding CsgD family transcriptional regulator